MADALDSKSKVQRVSFFWQCRNLRRLPRNARRQKTARLVSGGSTWLLALRARCARGGLTATKILGMKHREGASPGELASRLA
jgi:hypothetical protein